MRGAIFGVYFIVFVLCAIAPYDRTVWFAENLPIVFLMAAVFWFSRKHEFSWVSWLMLIVLPLLHTVGGHFTFERVPFGAVTDFFGSERNHYDRIAHFSVGLYAFAIAEYVEAKALINKRSVAVLFAVFSIFTVASAYEIIEWLYAISADSEAGLAVLGSQGDIWDAQKDMLADGMGAIFAVGLYCIFYRNRGPVEFNKPL